MNSEVTNVVVILSEGQNEILDEAAEALDRSRLSHYDAAEPADRRAKLEKLFDVAIDCLRRRQLDPMIAYAEQIGTERFEHGYGLTEVQTAFNVLEESMWRKLAAAVAPDEIVESLGLLTTVLGLGKDVFARTYVSLASRRHVPSLDLRALFDGPGG